MASPDYSPEREGDFISSVVRTSDDSVELVPYLYVMDKDIPTDKLVVQIREFLRPLLQHAFEQGRVVERRAISTIMGGHIAFHRDKSEHLSAMAKSMRQKAASTEALAESHLQILEDLMEIEIRMDIGKMSGTSCPSSSSSKDPEPGDL